MNVMKYWILAGVFFACLPNGYTQYEGGHGDGHDRAQAIQIDLQGQPYGITALYNGGNGDGHDRKQLGLWLNGRNANSLYSGGHGDGEDALFISAYLNGANVSSLFTGGSGDGHDARMQQLFLSGLQSSTMYSGGSGDGHDRFSVQLFLSGELLSMLYSGGNGDGHDIATVQSSISGFDLAALYGGGNGDGQDKADFTGSAIPFPVALLSFDAFPENDYVIIQWVTESEVNNDFFTVERSDDATLFGILEHVQGAGTTTEIQIYETIDPEPIFGRSYYRLKSTDFDGAFTYSHIVEVNMDAPSSWKLLVYPNPNSGEHMNLKLSGIEPGQEVHVDMIDMQGRTIWENDWLSDSPVLQEQIDLHRRLPEGTYHIRVSTANDQMSKLVIVR